MKGLLAKFMDRTFWRFILVGIVNTLFGSGIMFVFYNMFHFGYWVSSASNYFFGSILSYILNRSFTFKNHERVTKSGPRFVLNIAICYFVAYGLAKPLVRMVLEGASQTIQDNIAMLAGMCVFVVLNYLGQRLFVFRHRGEDKADG